MAPINDGILIGVTSKVANIKKRLSKRANATNKCQDGILLAVSLLVNINKLTKLQAKPNKAIIGKHIAFVHQTISKIC